MKNLILAAAALAMILPAAAGAQTNTGRFNRLSVGAGSPAVPVVGDVRLTGLGSSGGTGVLFTDANGDVIKRVLARADLPSAIAYEDEANVFTLDQTFSGDILVNGNDILSTGVLNIRPTGNLTLDPTGNIIVAADGLNVLPSTGYTYNIGALTNKFLTLYAAELWVETLVAQNTIATIGGRVLVGPTTVLTSDLASGATSMVVKHNQMVSGDRVYLEANGSVEFIAVTSAPSGSGPYTYTITRNLDGSGANNWTAGDAVFNTGTTGKGFIDLYSTSGVNSVGSGPTIVGNVRAGTTYNQIAPRWGIGNLNGLCGYATEVYGAMFGDCTTANVTIDATNGFRIRSGAANLLVADISGNLALTGNLSMGTAGTFFTNGVSGYGSGTGYWLSYNAGTPQFRVGNPAANYLAFDGTNTAIVSSNLTIDQTSVRVSANTANAYAAGNGFIFSPTVNTGGSFGMAAHDLSGFRGIRLNNVFTGSAIATLGISAGNAGSTSTSIDLTDDSTGGGGAARLISLTADEIRPVTANNTKLGTSTFVWGQSYIRHMWMNETSTQPASPASGTEVSVRMCGDKVVFTFNDGGTVRYKSFDLTGTNITWAQATSAPAGC